MPRSPIKVKYQVAPFGSARPWFAVVIDGLKDSARERRKAVDAVMRLLTKKYGRDNIRFFRTRGISMTTEIHHPKWARRVAFHLKKELEASPAEKRQMLSREQIRLVRHYVRRGCSKLSIARMMDISWGIVNRASRGIASPWSRR